MSRLIWNAVGSKFYEAGVDRGVLYLDGQIGVPWNGLTGVTESSSGGDPTPLYQDGVKYLNLSSKEEFEATLTAFTYPTEFAECDGTARVRPGLFLGQQRRKKFGLTYRTKIGNDVSGSDYAYKIHLVYNAMAQPSDRDYGTLGDKNDPSEFNWKLTTTPVAIPGFLPTAHMVLDSRYIDPIILGRIEDILYGSDSVNSHLPDFAELITQLDEPLAFSLTDNGDGTYIIDGPADILTVTSGLFTLTWPTAVDNSDGTYTISN